MRFWGTDYGFCPVCQRELISSLKELRKNCANGKLVISKSKQKISVSTTTKEISSKKLNKQNVTFSIKADAKTSLKYKKISGNKKISVSSDGKVTVKKSLKKGTYIVKMKLTASENDTYEKTEKTVTIKVKVK